MDDGDRAEESSPVATGAVWHTAARRARRAQLWWSPTALVCIPVTDDDTALRDVVVQPPWSLARTVWRLWRLGPRPRPAREATAPMAELPALASGLPAPWLADLGLRPDQAHLLRLDLTASGSHLGTEVVVDGHDAGCWYAEGTTRLRLRPTEPGELMARLLAWQRRLDRAMAPAAAPGRA